MQRVAMDRLFEQRLADQRTSDICYALALVPSYRSFMPNDLEQRYAFQRR